VAILLRGLAKFADLEQCSARLAVLEARHSVPEGSISILAALGDTPSSVGLLSLVWPVLPRLGGLIFIAERLLDNFSVSPSAPPRDWPDPIRLARSLTVLKAKELAVPALLWRDETNFDPDFDHCAKRDGFSGIISGSQP